MFIMLFKVRSNVSFFCYQIGTRLTIVIKAVELQYFLTVIFIFQYFCKTKFDFFVVMRSGSLHVDREIFNIISKAGKQRQRNIMRV